jgi:hypothetical protein
MEGLTVTRVAVLDDDEKEGMEIIRALWRRQIPALYFRGVEDAPAADSLLTGIRLLFLDMDLVPGAGETRTKVSTLVATIRRIVSPDNGPYSVIAWTKHMELVEEFEKYIFERNDMGQPINVVAISKDACRDDADEFDIDKIKAVLDATLVEFSPLMFLQSWEASCLDAAIRVTAELSTLAQQGVYSSPKEFRDNWKLQLLRMMHSMAKAAGGRAIKEDRDVAFAAFCSALSPLHADRLESRKSQLCETMHSYSDQILSDDVSNGCDKSAISRINTMLHCSYDRLHEFYAGNLYLATDRTSFGKLIVNPNEFISGFVDGSPRSDDWKRGFNTLKEHAIPVVLESNPTCDHSQKKVKIARLVAGLLIPRTEIDKPIRPVEARSDPITSNWETRVVACVHRTAEWWHSVMGETNPDARLPEYRFVKTADFLFMIGPLNLDIPHIGRADYYIVLNAQYLFSLPKKEAEKEVAQFRLRTQAFTNFQFWFGNHSSRPGMLMVR